MTSIYLFLIIIFLFSDQYAIYNSSNAAVDHYYNEDIESEYLDILQTSQKKTMTHNGFVFHIKKRLKNAIVYECKKRKSLKCKVTIHSTDGRICKVSGQHCHS